MSTSRGVGQLLRPRDVHRVCFAAGRIVAAAIGSGALGFLLKSDDPQHLLDRTRALAAGGAWFSPHGRALARPPRIRNTPARPPGGGRRHRAPERPAARGPRSARTRSLQPRHRPTAAPDRGHRQAIRQRPDARPRRHQPGPRGAARLPGRSHRHRARQPRHLAHRAAPTTSTAPPAGHCVRPSFPLRDERLSRSGR